MAKYKNNYQLTCPRCHFEFSYNQNYYDRKINDLANEIGELNSWFANFNLLGTAEKKRMSREREYKVKKLTELQRQISELKGLRKVYNKMRDEAQLFFIKQIFREKYGEQAFDDLIEAVEAELEAYTASGLMLHEYTRGRYKSNVTSINKL